MRRMQHIRVDAFRPRLSTPLMEIETIQTHKQCTSVFVLLRFPKGVLKKSLTKRVHPNVFHPSHNYYSMCVADLVPLVEAGTFGSGRNVCRDERDEFIAESRR